MGTHSKNAFLHREGQAGGQENGHLEGGGIHDKTHLQSYGFIWSGMCMRDALQDVMGKRSGAGAGYKLYYDAPNEKLHWLISDGTDVIEVSAPLPFDGEWHMIGVTYDGSLGPAGMNIMVDGEQPTLTTEQAGPLTSTTSNLVSFFVGEQGSAPGSGLSNALTTWCMFYDAVITLSTFAEIYNGGDPIPPVDASQLSDLASWWVPDFKIQNETDVSSTPYLANVISAGGANPLDDQLDHSRSGNPIDALFTNPANDYIADNPGGIYNRSYTGVTAGTRHVMLADHPELKFTNGTPFSVEFWFRFNPSGAGAVAWVSKYDSGGPAGWSIQSNDLANRTLYWFIENASGFALVYWTPDTADDDAWHHAVFTFTGGTDASAMLIYVDSVENTTIDTDTWDGADFDHTEQFQVSGRNGTPLTLDDATGPAQVTGVRVYDRALSQADVNARYNGGTPTYPPDWLDPVLGPVCYLPMAHTFQDLEAIQFAEPEDLVDIGFGDGGGGGASGGAPPTITNFVPPVGTTLGSKQSIGFDITDDVAVKRGMVLVTMGNEMLVVHDGDTFRGRFSGNREIVGPGLHRFSNVIYAPGWTAAPTFEFLVTDDAGQEAV